MLCQHGQTLARCVARGLAGLLLYAVPWQLRQSSGKPVGLHLGCFGVLRCPCVLLFVTIGGQLAQFGESFLVEFGHIGENLEGIVGIAA